MLRTSLLLLFCAACGAYGYDEIQPDFKVPASTEGYQLINVMTCEDQATLVAVLSENYAYVGMSSSQAEIRGPAFQKMDGSLVVIQVWQTLCVSDLAHP